MEGPKSATFNANKKERSQSKRFFFSMQIQKFQYYEVQQMIAENKAS